MIREKYLGEDPNPLWRGKPLTLENLPGKRRIAVSVEDRFVSRSYTVLGVYDLSETESTDLNRVYRRLTDEKAKDLVPEIYEETK